MAKKRKRHNDAVVRSNQQLDKELRKQVALIYSATAIALKRYWGWGKDRI